MMFQHTARMMAAAGISGMFMLLLVGAIHVMPKPVPGINPQQTQNFKIEQGVYTKKDFFGLVKYQLVVQNGKANGPCFHFYPNGSVYRIMEYRNGLLEGEVWEFYEAAGQRGVRANLLDGRRAALGAGVGSKKGFTTYRAGVLNGPYQKLSPDGKELERGTYLDGKLLDGSHDSVAHSTPQSLSGKNRLWN